MRTKRLLAPSEQYMQDIFHEYVRSIHHTHARLEGQDIHEDLEDPYNTAFRHLKWVHLLTLDPDTKDGKGLQGQYYTALKAICKGFVIHISESLYDNVPPTDKLAELYAWWMLIDLPIWLRPGEVFSWKHIDLIRRVMQAMLAHTTTTIFSGKIFRETPLPLDLTPYTELIRVFNEKTDKVRAERALREMEGRN